jgi:hypothetical protein
VSCFNCGREGHVARNCRRPTHKVGIGRDTKDVFGSVGRDTQFRAGVGRDTRYRGSFGRGIVSTGRAGKDWIRSGNDRRVSSSNPTITRRLK